MAKDEHFSIFDAAGQSREKKKPKKAPLAGKIPPPRESLPASIAPPPPPAAAPAEFNQIIKKIRAMEEDLQKKFDRICALTGMSRKELDQYVQNPQNFTTLQWKKAQQKKELLEKKLYDTLGLRAKINVLKKKKQEMDRERRGKTLGGRKRWLQM